jgi:hypothetical protein
VDDYILKPLDRLKSYLLTNLRHAQMTLGTDAPLTPHIHTHILEYVFFFFFFFYSCCSHLEHRASGKRFVSLQFLNLRHSVGLLGRGISPSQGRYLTQTQNERTQTSVSRVRFEPTIPPFERAKTFHALCRSATVICTGIRYVTSVSIL